MLKQILTLILLTSVMALASPGDHLKMGDKLPKIKEADQFGKIRKFSEVQGKNGTLLVIFRSADW